MAHFRRSSQPANKAISVTTHGISASALGRIRTSDTRFRKPVLYPLSYEGRGGMVTNDPGLRSEALKAVGEFVR